MEKPSFVNVELPGMEATHRSVKLELTLILDGPEDLLTVGFEIRSHATDELLALEARGGRAIFASSDWMTAQVLDAVRIALGFLSPF